MKEDFQDRGEPWRAVLGIDGTAGDAQDIRHEFIPDSPGGPCVVCGLAESYRKHRCGRQWHDDDGMLRFCALDYGHAPECATEEGWTYSETVTER